MCHLLDSIDSMYGLSKAQRYSARLQLQNESRLMTTKLIMLEYVFVGIAFLCAVGIVLFYNAKKNINGNAEFSSCRNPNCVRCVQYQQVMIRAYERYQQLSKINKENTDSTGRIHKSLHRNIVHSNGSSEQLLNHYSEPNPLVFDLKELNLNDLYDPSTTDQFTDDVTVLQDNKDKICSDFHRINRPQYQHLWLKNDTPFGQWSVFHLINQGKTVVNNIKHCEKTFEIISGLQNIMKRNVFGNVVFSVINPGTVISTHYGPTNIRIRCHLGTCIAMYIH